MKEIDEWIRKAIKRAAADCGSVLGLSRRLGVSHSTALFWSSGKTRSIDGDVWRYKVYPLLERYLKEDGWEGAHSVKDAPGGYSAQRRGGAGAFKLHEVPVIGRAQAAGFDPALEAFDSYARGCGEDSAYFATEPKDGYFALKVEGRSMEPELPEGTLILVAGGEFARNGDVAVARIKEGGQVVVKRYRREGSRATLESLNPGGASYEWDCHERRGYLEWMYPVIEAKLDLRAQRECHKNA